MRLVFLAGAFLAIITFLYAAPDSVPTATPTPVVLPSPTPTETARPVKPSRKPTVVMEGSSNVLLLHKPFLPPEWGELIQYKRETTHVLFDRNKETIHEFVLKGDDGILRVAFYHEPQDEEGYWEIWIWDQP